MQFLQSKASLQNLFLQWIQKETVKKQLHYSANLKIIYLGFLGFAAVLKHGGLFLLLLKEMTVMICIMIHTLKETTMMTEML